jgi:hypothetical protein
LENFEEKGGDGGTAREMGKETETEMEMETAQEMEENTVVHLLI